MKALLIFLCPTWLFLPNDAWSGSIIRDTITSAVLHEVRELQIYLPDTYEKGQRTYPVVYILDGESLFLPATGAVSFLSRSFEIPRMPEAIVVGVSNTARQRDMPVPQQFGKSDGAINFLHFLVRELVPLINKRYPTSGLNVLIGHSQGGYFATYAGVEQPEYFRYILAMDAPMIINENVREQFRHKLALSSLRYVSAEGLYGWKEEVVSDNKTLQFTRIVVEGESHESMAYEGIYEGLKALFHDYTPKVNDLSAPALEQYYGKLSENCHCRMPPPPAVILGSANRKIAQSRKEEALDLIRLYEQIYGSNATSAKLSERAGAITGSPDPRVEEYLRLPQPSAEQIAPYLGTWKGVLHVPGGHDMTIEFEVKEENGTYLVTKADFFGISEKGELIWGRKHNWGGLYVSIGTLSADGSTLRGTEDLIGVQPPPGITIPKDKPRELNTFEYRKEAQ